MVFSWGHQQSGQNLYRGSSRFRSRRCNRHSGYNFGSSNAHRSCWINVNSHSTSYKIRSWGWIQVETVPPVVTETTCGTVVLLSLFVFGALERPCEADFDTALFGTAHPVDGNVHAHRFGKTWLTGRVEHEFDFEVAICWAIYDTGSSFAAFGCSFVVLGCREYWALIIHSWIGLVVSGTIAKGGIISVAALEGIPVRGIPADLKLGLGCNLSWDPRLSISTVETCTWVSWFLFLIDALVTQLFSLTDFTLRLCVLSSENASPKEWLAFETSSVSSNSGNVASASFSFFFLQFSKHQCLFFLIRFSSCSRRCCSCVSLWRSSSCSCWARPNKLSFCRSVSSHRCFARRSSQWRWLEVLEIREKDVWEIWEKDLTFGAALTEGWEVFSVSGRTSIYSRIFFGFHSHVAQRIF